VIQRVTNGRADKYVAKPGSEQSYTTDVTQARVYANAAEANRDRCQDNEIVVFLASLFPITR
jgi:hypothetical protein